MLKTYHGPKPLINKDMTLTELGLLYLVIRALLSQHSKQFIIGLQTSEDCFFRTAPAIREGVRSSAWLGVGIGKLFKSPDQSQSIRGLVNCVVYLSLIQDRTVL